jgi:putative selenium metabolism hydrolase
MTDIVQSLADKYFSSMLAFARDLIRIPSPSGKEGEVITRIKAEMEHLGFEKIKMDSFGNCTGQMGRGPRLIAVDGHCDTVGIGNEKNWSFDPFSGEVKDGFLYGRGAADQKAGLAAAIYASRIAADIGFSDAFSIMTAASVCEEDFEGLCWRHLIEQEKIRPELVLLTEPTDGALRAGQRGRIELKVRVRGKSSHGSAPERGDNAVEKIAAVIRDIAELNSRFSGSSDLGKSSAAVTDVRSNSPSLCAVPDEAECHIDMRLTKGETMESALDLIKNLPSAADFNAEVFVPEYDVLAHTGHTFPARAFYPAWMLEKDHPVLKAAAASYKSCFGKRAETGPWTFSTNGTAICGVNGIPCIGYGPGEERMAHAPDEHVSLESMKKALLFYADFLCRICAS